MSRPVLKTTNEKGSKMNKRNEEGKAVILPRTRPALKILKFKSGRDYRSGNHSQTLTRQSKKSLTGDLNDDYLLLTILNKMAAQQTKKLDPQMGRQRGEIPGSAMNPGGHSGPDDHSERD